MAVVSRKPAPGVGAMPRGRCAFTGQEARCLQIPMPRVALKKQARRRLRPSRCLPSRSGPAPDDREWRLNIHELAGQGDPLENCVGTERSRNIRIKNASAAGFQSPLSNRAETSRAAFQEIQLEYSRVYEGPFSEVLWRFLSQRALSFKGISGSTAA